MDARKARLGPADLDTVLAGVEQILVARGKKVVELKPGDGLDVEELQRLVLGRSGTLRAPVARAGKSCLVGFNEAAWSSVLAS